jgi:hypothetical protein
MDDSRFEDEPPVSFWVDFSKYISLWLGFEVWGAVAPVLVAWREHQAVTAIYQPADVCLIFAAFVMVRAAEYFARLFGSSRLRSFTRKTAGALMATLLVGTLGVELGTLFKTSTWFLPDDRWLYAAIYALIATLVIAAASADAAREDVSD